MALKPHQITKAPPGNYALGDCLYLQVNSTGARSWLFRYQLNGQRRFMGLGPIWCRSLHEARAEAARLRVMVRRDKIDPLAGRPVRRRGRPSIQPNARGVLFKDATDAYIIAHQSSWRNFKHRQQWDSTLRTYAFPVLGDMAVSDITPGDVLAVLQPIWSAKPETASRVRMRIEAVLDSAKVQGWRCGDNPAAWRGGLEAALPPRSKVRKVRHHPALPWQEAASFMAGLAKQSGVSARALEFLIHTAGRSGEIRHARWHEIDLDEKMWTISADRMKAQRDHRVPLTEAALTILARQPKGAGTDLLFPSYGGRPLSDMSLSAVLRRMNFNDITVHGFRSTFRDWAAEQTTHQSETIEMALAHTVANKVEAAYRRGELLAKRRLLMEDWSKWLDDGKLPARHSDDQSVRAPN